MSYSHFTLNGHRFAVRFISFAFGVAHYGVSIARRDDEARIEMRGDSILPHTFADRMERDHGFTFDDACTVVRLFVAQRFDNDVREIVRMGALDCADPDVQARAVALGLVAPGTLAPL